MAVFLQNALRFLVLHDGAAEGVDVVSMRVAEPVADVHVEMDHVGGVFLKLEIQGEFNGEIILVELCVIVVLSDAEVDVHRGEVAVFVKVFAVEFHVMVAAAERIRPEHVALRRIGEKAGDVVLLIQAEGETHRNVSLARDGSDCKGLAFRDVGVDVKHFFLRDF